MALFEMNYYSDALKMTTTVNVILPEKTKNSPGRVSFPYSEFSCIDLLVVV